MYKKTITNIFLCLTAILFMLSGAATSLAQPVTAKVSVDNYYALYTGDANAASNYVNSFTSTSSGNGFWTAKQSTTGVLTNQDYIYIVAWSDKSTAQGLLVSLKGIQTIHGGDPRWEVYPSNSTFNDATNPSLSGFKADLNAAINAANTGSLWTVPFVGADNTGSFSWWGSFSNNQIDPSAKWMWYKSGNCAQTQYTPFYGGCDHREFLVFRLAARHLLVPANFNPPVGCVGSPVQFTDLSSGATSWLWTFGDGQTSTQQNPQHTYTAAGTYQVTLCINGVLPCTTKSVVISAPPATPVITTNQTAACNGSGATVTYTVNNVSGLTYAWSVSGGTISGPSNSSTVNVTWNGTGSGVLTVTVKSVGCPSTASSSITVPPCPTDLCCQLRIQDSLPATAVVHQSDGVYSITPTLTWGPSTSIRRVTIDIISATLTPMGACASATTPLNSYVINAGQSLPNLLNPALPVPYSHEVIWTGTTPLISGQSFPFTVQFPNPPSSPCNDTLKFCIRYTITDAQCRTCEIIRCYSSFREGEIPHSQINATKRTGDSEADASTGAALEKNEAITQSVRSTRTARQGQSAPERELRGPIWDKWRSLGGAQSFLGQPVTGELPIPNFIGEGILARFQGGSIYFTPESRAVAIPDLAGSLIPARDYTQLKRTADDQLADPFVQLKAGRLAYVVAVGNGEYGLGDSTTQREVLILLDPRRGLGEYFIVENRFRPDQNNTAANGVAVWHVVEDLGLFNRVKPPAELLGEFGEHGLRLLRHATGQQTALTQPGEVLTSESLPPLRWLDGSAANFEVRLLSASGATVRLAVTTLR